MLLSALSAVVMSSLSMAPSDTLPCAYAQTATTVRRTLATGRQVELVQTIVEPRNGRLVVDLRALPKAGSRAPSAADARAFAETIGAQVAGTPVQRAEIRVCRRTGASGATALVARHQFTRTASGRWVVQESEPRVPRS